MRQFHWPRRLFAALVAASLLLAAGCAKQAPEAAVRAQVQALQGAIDARDAGAVHALLTDDFIGNDGLDKRGARQLAAGVFLRYRDVGARLGPVEVELRGDAATRALLGSDVLEATEEDWRTEYNAPILSIRIVDDLDSAIEHINTYGSQHTDAIVSENFSNARRFLAEVDSASVMVNASTRFADGFEYGLGAEIGISTDKLHARGPVGLEGLTSEKYVVFGDGHVRT